ncbi:MAG TPA: thioredoxin [Nanoarchaeota archaeon]|nr:thioredoxin [Nanoarchaeota archaeon]
MQEVKHVTMQNFEQEVMQSELPVIIDFWAEWCIPCKIAMPIFEELAKEYSGKVKFVKINVDESPDLALKFSVQSIPTFIVFYKGKVINRLTGAVAKEYLKDFIEKALSSIE